MKEWSRSEVEHLAAHASGVVPLGGANLAGLDLADLDLRGADFSHATLTCANLSHADVRHAVFFGATARSACFQAADLRGTNLTAADLSQANLSDARLDAAILTGTEVTGAWSNDVGGLLRRGAFVATHGPTVVCLEMARERATLRLGVGDEVVFDGQSCGGLAAWRLLSPALDVLTAMSASGAALRFRGRRPGTGTIVFGRDPESRSGRPGRVAIVVVVVC